MKISRQSYLDSKSYPEKVLQFGEGNFLRCFVDWMFHQLNKQGNFNGSVVVVQPIEQGMVNMLNDQDGLYTLYLRGLNQGQVQNSYEIVDVISRGVNPYTDFQAYLTTAENPDMRFVVSNTTEAGIYFEETDTPSLTPPKSFAAKLAVWLHHRYTHFNGDLNKGVHIIPCELINKNADQLKQVMLKLVDKWGWDSGFTQWLEKACTFNNSLVDRIVPGYPRERLAEIKAETGFEDNQIVEGEPFHLWVIENNGSLSDELPFDKIGLNVVYTNDITPYRSRKVRILNGAHTCLVPVAYLYGTETVRESVEHEVIGGFLQKAIYNEIIPTLDLPEQELKQFASDVIERFKNPFIKHQLMSIALNSWSKFETRVLPSILTYQKLFNKVPELIAFSLASNIIFYTGKRNGEDIKLADDKDIIELLERAWINWQQTKNYSQLVSDVFSYESLWKMNLAENVQLAEAVAKYVQQIHEKGMEQSLQQLLSLNVLETV